MSENQSRWEALISKTAFYGLMVTGLALNQATKACDVIANVVEPMVIPVLNRLQMARIDSSQNESLTNNSNHLYEYRNQILKIIEMAMYLTPFNLPPVTSIGDLGTDNEIFRHFHIYSSGKFSEPLAFCFSGCSWLLFYELGVARAIVTYLSDNVIHNSVFAGSGTGAVVAALIVDNTNITAAHNLLKEVVVEVGKRICGPVGKMSTIWRSALDKLLVNIHLPDKKLYITLTEFPSMKSIVTSHYATKNDLIDTLMASMYMPGLFEVPIAINNRMYVNGSFGDKCPKIDGFLCTSVTPYLSKGNICPKTVRYSVINELFPSSDGSTYERMFHDGFNDASTYFKRMLDDGYLPKPYFKEEFFNLERNKL